MDGADVTGVPSQRVRSSKYSGPDGTRRTSSDETREKPMSGTRNKGGNGGYRAVTRLIATPDNRQKIPTSDQLRSSLGTLCWPGSPANYWGQTQVDYPAYSDGAVRGKQTTGTRIGLRATICVPRPISDTIGRAPGSIAGLAYQRLANCFRELQPTTGGI